MRFWAFFLLFSGLAIAECLSPSGTPCMTVHYSTSEWSNVSWGITNVRHTTAEEIFALDRDGRRAMHAKRRVADHYVLHAFTLRGGMLLDPVRKVRLGWNDDSREYFTVPFNEPPVLRRTGPLQCGFGTKPMGTDTLLGIPVQVFEQPMPGGRKGTITSWYAPSLGCREIKTRMLETNEFGIPTRHYTKQATDVRLGEPDRTLFEVPFGYTHRDIQR